MYTVIYHESVKDDLKKIQASDKLRIRKAIEKKLAVNPALFGEALQNNLSGLRKLRVGNYRIVYEVQVETKTLVIIIAHRRDVYEKIKKRIKK